MDEQSLFAELLELTNSAERESRLDQATRNDRALRDRLERLLAKHSAAGSFLERPPPGTEEFAAAAMEEPDAVIGAYRLLERIGEGGMGVVYLAEQSEPVHRRVALKIIKPGMDTREVVARFNAERQALAIMDHPNIAKVFDGGATAAGRPYFVMELVRGLPITEYCDQAKLTPQSRLKLFVQVCRAVQHAHQKAIIHRDLKPSNILITLHDGDPVPKVIDFGVAKAVGQKPTEQSAYTRFTQMIGTPLYMSPEQAELSALDIDTRSDVYSLGVLLYELLTGTTPFESDVMRRASFDELRRIIREDEPPRPSARISTLDAATRSTTSAQRGLDERQLSRLLSGDLDWIVMKALEKDRNRRYESAGAFAADIERYLANEPVEARPPSKAYRVRKFVRRNRGKLAVATALVAAIAAVAANVGWTQWKTARRDAMIEQAVADALIDAGQFEEQGQWSDARAAVERAAAILGEGKRPDVEERRRVHSLLQRLEEIQLDTSDLVNEGLARKGGAVAYHDAFREFGLDHETLEPTEFASRLPAGVTRKEIIGALDDWTKLQRHHFKDEKWKRVLAVARAADSDKWSDRLRATWEKGKSADRATVLELSSTASVNNLHPLTVRLLVDLLIVSGDHPKAIQFLQESVRQRPNNYLMNSSLGYALGTANPPRLDEALGYYRAALSLKPGNLTLQLGIGLILQSLRRLDESVAVYEQALQANPNNYTALNGLGVSFMESGNLDRAESTFLLAIRVAPERHPAHFNFGLVRWKRRDFSAAANAYKEAARLEPSYAKAHLYYGHALIRLGRHADALNAYQEVVRLEPRNWEVHHAVAATLSDMNDIDGAIAAFRQAIKFKPDTSSPELAARIAKPHAGLGLLLVRKRQFAEGIPELQEALRLDKKLADVHRELGPALVQMGKDKEGIEALQEATRLFPKEGYYHFMLGNAFLQSQQFESAIATFRESSRLNPDHAQSFCNLGYALKQTKKYREALDAYRRGHELGSKSPDWKFPSEKWIKECEALVEAAEKQKPADPAPDKPPSHE